jgi:hypothetical protein
MKLVYRWQFISIFTELKLDYNPWFMIYIYICFFDDFSTKIIILIHFQLKNTFTNTF